MNTRAPSRTNLAAATTSPAAAAEAAADSRRAERIDAQSVDLERTRAELVRASAVLRQHVVLTRPRAASAELRELLALVEAYADHAEAYAKAETALEADRALLRLTRGDRR